MTTHRIPLSLILLACRAVAQVMVDPSMAPVTAPPVTSTPVTAAPVTPPPVPLTMAPITPAPVTAPPVTPVPTTAAPVTSAPVTAAPVTAAPTAAPVTAAPVTNAPVTSPPVTFAPVAPRPVFSNRFGIPFPRFRYQLWSDLDELLRPAEVLGYDETSWEMSPHLEEVEAKAFVDLFDGQQQAAAALGYDEATWDCFQNHFTGYGWNALVGNGLNGPWEVLGWNRDLWVETNETLWPESSFKGWDELTAEEQQAAADVGYFYETWNALNFSDWVTDPDNSLDALASAPTAAPVEAPTSGSLSRPWRFVAVLASSLVWMVA